MEITDLSWWYGTMGESVFDRYSFAHAFAFVWVAIFISLFVRGLIAVLVILALCAGAWETFESHVLVGLAIEPFGGTETPRNRYIGDTISDMSGYITFVLAVWSARRGMVPRPGARPLAEPRLASQRAPAHSDSQRRRP